MSGGVRDWDIVGMRGGMRGGMRDGNERGNEFGREEGMRGENERGD